VTQATLTIAISSVWITATAAPVAMFESACKWMRTLSPKNLLTELKRRNLIRAVILYVGAVWALAQGISQLGPSVGAPEWATRWFLVAAAIGFPFSIAFGWFYEFTPEGLKRESEIDPAQSIAHHKGASSTSRSSAYWRLRWCYC